VDPGVLCELLDAWTLAGLLGEAPRDKVLAGIADPGREARRAVQDVLDRAALVPRIERRAADRELVREHADCPRVDEVGVVQVRLLLVVVGVALVGADDHLRCHVVECAHTCDWPLLCDVDRQAKVCRSRRGSRKNSSTTSQ
jgi:hypothetical protein